MTSGPETKPGLKAMTVSGAPRSNGGMMSHSTNSGVESTTPDGLIARTSNLCGPTARPSTVCGDVHGAKSAPSSEHSKSERIWPVIGSSPENSKTAMVPSVSSSGSRSIEVSGALTSTYTHERVAGVGSTLPNSSMARIVAVWRP